MYKFWYKIVQILQLSKNVVLLQKHGHFLTLVKIKDGKILVYNSLGNKIYKTNENGEVITEYDSKCYEEGFDLEEDIMPWIKQYIVIDSEFRNDGNDYNRLPEIDSTGDNVTIFNPNTNTILESDWTITNDVESENGAKGKEILGITDYAPIHFHKKSP